MALGIGIRFHVKGSDQESIHVLGSMWHWELGINFTLRDPMVLNMTRISHTCNKDIF